MRELKRQRYMSESAAQGDSQEMLPHGSKVFICSEVSKSGSSLCVSMDFGLGEQSKSTLTHIFLKTTFEIFSPGLHLFIQL